MTDRSPTDERPASDETDRATTDPDDTTTDTDQTMTDDETERTTTEEPTNERAATERTDGPSMRDVDHTHPYTGTPFGEQGVYDRGPDDASGATEAAAADHDEDAAARDDEDGEAVAPADDDGDDEGPVSAVRRIQTDGGSPDDRRPNWAVHRRPDAERDR